MNRLLFLLLLTISHFSSAQGKVVNGVVNDESCHPFTGVQVINETTEEIVRTDFDGKYSINAQPNQKLIFTFLGMKPQAVIVGNSITIDIVLFEEEAIVTSDQYRTTSSFKDPGYLATSNVPNAFFTKNLQDALDGQFKNSNIIFITTYKLNRDEIDSIYKSYCNTELIKKVISGNIEANQEIIMPENIFYYLSVINCDGTNIEIKRKIFTEKIIWEWNFRNKDLKVNEYPFRCGASQITSEMNAIPIYDKQMAAENFMNSHKNINSYCIYLIDGKPFNVSSERQFMRLSKKIKKLKLYNIAALSGDGATSMFGSRGRNGVYILTTKKSKR